MRAKVALFFECAKFFVLLLAPHGFAIKIEHIHNFLLGGRLVDADIAHFAHQSEIDNACTVLLVDARHKPTTDDIVMLNYIRERHGFAFVVATKCDKIPKTKLNDHLDEIYYTLELEDDDIMMPFSAETGMGRDELWEAIKELCEIE